jgi:hypothetical protein
VADGNSEPVERIRRSAWQFLLLVLARPSVWMIWVIGTAAGSLVFTLVLPHWIWELGSPLYLFGVLAPLCVWRMRVLDARAVAEGRLAIPEPRRLPASALDPAPAQLRATVDEGLRRLARSCWVNGVGLLAGGLAMAAAAIFLVPDDMPRWAFALMTSVGAVWVCWLALRTIPRFLAAARKTRDGLVAGAVPRHVGRVVRVSGYRPIVEVADSATLYQAYCEWTAPRGVRADDEVLVVGEWRQGMVVLVTGASPKGRPRSFWGELRPAD